MATDPSGHFEIIGEQARSDQYRHITVTEAEAQQSQETAEFLATALRVHARGYAEAGFVTQAAILPDGTLDPALDHSRGPRVEYRLAVNYDDEGDIATLRKVHLLPGQTYRNLPSYGFCGNELTDTGRRWLENLPDADRRLKELSALAKVGTVSPMGVMELIRDVIQESMGTDEVLFFSTVTATYATLTKWFGEYNFMPVGNDVAIADGRVQRGTALRPTIAIPSNFIGNVLRSYHEAKDPKTRHTLSRSFLYLTEGLSRAQLGSDLYEARHGMLDAQENDALRVRLEEHRAEVVPWSPPQLIDASNDVGRHLLDRLVASGTVKVDDRIEYIANGLFELTNPDRRNDKRLREQFVASILAQGPAFGVWAYLPWSGRLVRYPQPEALRALHTASNRNLIRSDSEQSRLYDATVAVFGLSVGSAVVEQLIASGIGGRFIIGDADYITPANTNRIRAGMPEVGERKIDHVAKYISEVDPFILQLHFVDGINTDGLAELAAARPSIIFDEVDDLQTKAMLRMFARANHIPLVMVTDVGDRSLVDVERYDLGDELAVPFGGRINEQELRELAAGLPSVKTEAERERYRRRMLVKIIGYKNVTTRMLESVLEIDHKLTSMPQLGPTANAGGSLGAQTAREILLGRPMSSGRHVESAARILGMRSHVSLGEYLRVRARFAASVIRSRQKR